MHCFGGADKVKANDGELFAESTPAESLISDLNSRGKRKEMNSFPTTAECEEN